MPKSTRLAAAAIAAAAAEPTVIASAVAPKEGVAVCGIGGLRGVSHHAAHSALKLKLLHPRPEGVGFVLTQLIQHFLNAGSGIRVDRSGVHGVLILPLLDKLLRLAAAVLILESGLIDRASYAGESGTQVALKLRDELGLLVKSAPYSILQIVEVHGIAQPRLGDRLAAATIAPAAEASAPHHGQEQKREEPHTLAAEHTAPAIVAVLICAHGIAKSHISSIVHCFFSLQKMKIYNLTAPDAA